MRRRRRSSCALNRNCSARLSRAPSKFAPLDSKDRSQSRFCPAGEGLSTSNRRKERFRRTGSRPARISGSGQSFRKAPGGRCKPARAALKEQRGRAATTFPDARAARTGPTPQPGAGRSSTRKMNRAPADSAGREAGDIFLALQVVAAEVQDGRILRVRRDDEHRLLRDGRMVLRDPLGECSCPGAAIAAGDPAG